MDFIGGCKGSWRRDKVAQQEDGGAGFNIKTLHQADGSNRNGKMREEVGGSSSHILPRLYMQVEDFRPVGA